MQLLMNVVQTCTGTVRPPQVVHSSGSLVVSTLKKPPFFLIAAFCNACTLWV